MQRLPHYLILDHKMDRLSRDELHRMQSERLQAMVSYCYHQTPFWRRKFDAAGLVPEDIRSMDDLPQIPFCTKTELQEDQAKHPPFGSYVAIPRTQWSHFSATSGTTGHPLRRVLSARDWQYMIDRFRRNPTMGPGDIVVILGPVDALIGPMVSSATAAAMGAMVVQAGLYDSAAKLRLIADLRPTAVSGTASYLMYLVELAQDLGIDLPGLGVRVLSAFGEPGIALEETREKLRRAWGVNRIADGYGITEIFPLGGNCAHSTSLHIAGDLAATEIVDPETGQPLPAGETGEVVITNLVGESQPLLRYRTRDISRLATDTACACGFTGLRLEGSIVGRVDDMIWLRGANVFPSAIEAVVRGIPGLTPEYQIEVSGTAGLSTLTVRVEADSGDATVSEKVALQDNVSRAIRAAIRVSAAVEVVPAGTLPRPDGRSKIRRVRVTD
jgi:phenylacetate-CoA ligase